MAIGTGSIAASNFTFTVGHYTKAGIQGSVASGYQSLTGHGGYGLYSWAHGFQVTSSVNYGLTIGRYNTTGLSTPPNYNMFEVGVGETNTLRKTAFSVGYYDDSDGNIPYITIPINYEKTSTGATTPIQSSSFGANDTANEAKDGTIFFHRTEKKIHIYDAYNNKWYRLNDAMVEAT